MCLVPSKGLNITGDGNYLVHSEATGVPHCVGLKVVGDECVVYDLDCKYTMTRAQLWVCENEAIDRSSMATFEIKQPTPLDGAAAADHAVPADATLMNLQAGGRGTTRSRASGSADVTKARQPHPPIPCRRPASVLNVQAKTSTRTTRSDLPYAHADGQGTDKHDADCDTDSTDDSVDGDAHGDGEPTAGDEATVNVGSRLLDLMRGETLSYADSVKQICKRSDNNRMWCALCPFRSFDRLSRLSAHLKQYHTAEQQFVCSGTKQLKVVVALYDNDCCTLGSSGGYLRRSASCIRTTVVPPLPSSNNELDRYIRLVLTARGPEYHNVHTIETTNTYRRVRNMYITHDFAELLRMEALINRVKINSVVARITARVASCGSELASLLPSYRPHWWPLLEDVFSSPASLSLCAMMDDFHIEADELAYISFDATFRCCLSICGQASYRAPRAVRENAAFTDADSVRRVFTARGRTGAVIGMIPIASEEHSIVVCALETLNFCLQEGDFLVLRVQASVFSAKRFHFSEAIT